MYFRPKKKRSRFLIKTFCKCKCGMKFLLSFFFAAAQEAQQTNHFSSAHGTDRQFTFLFICFLYLKNKKKLMRHLFWNAGADEKPGFFFFYLSLFGPRHQTFVFCRSFSKFVLLLHFLFLPVANSLWRCHHRLASFKFDLKRG